MKSRSRQDAIVRTLRRTGTTTIDALVREVGASRSTILRDLSALRDEGYVIHAEQGRGGGVYLDPGSVQATARLSVAEVFALIIGVSSMRAARTLPFSGVADAGLAKIEKALPPDRLRDLRRLLDCLYVGPLAPEIDTSNLGEMDPALLTAFETSFLERQCMRFRYRDAKRAETERQVEPQAMLILPPLWYLVAWDPARGDFRHFRMDRISRPEVIEGTSFRSRHVHFDDGVRAVRYA
ncbi:WYL domain-containing protein [Roseibacterium sp. SDUM158017]|uniref:helix-turn-helix transcriptional regulator n=1 Tax=Roseicyclus salinarum TaxID=3036773 RepID=UPI002414E285|nr:WYL domain-containing protein [Roseibacterium sp. SDUM158017]MDG4650388.1 WYL domain-containing protein [Roseibacterium sp. SDUM158017]